MKHLVLLFVLAGAPAAAAQEPPAPPEGRGDSVRVERLRIEIERRFAERVQVELGLSGDQATKLRATQERFGARRRELLRQQFLHREALQRQMRPGVGANAESVRVHMDGMQAGRAGLVQLEQDEDREMAGYLTPVQRAQFQFMRQRFLERVNEMRRERQMRPGMQRPRGQPPQGQRPRRRP